MLDDRDVGRRWLTFGINVGLQWNQGAAFFERGPEC